MYAIQPKGVGKPVSARKVRDGWSLENGETFFVDNWNSSLVLDTDEVSLRSKTQQEIDAPNIDNLRGAAIEAEMEAILTAGTTAEAIAYQNEL